MLPFWKSANRVSAAADSRSGRKARGNGELAHGLRELARQERFRDRGGGTKPHRHARNIRTPPATARIGMKAKRSRRSRLVSMPSFSGMTRSATTTSTGWTNAMRNPTDPFSAPSARKPARASSIASRKRRSRRPASWARRSGASAASPRPAARRAFERVAADREGLVECLHLRFERSRRSGSRQILHRRRPPAYRCARGRSTRRDRRQALPSAVVRDRHGRARRPTKPRKDRPHRRAWSRTGPSRSADVLCGLR